MEIIDNYRGPLSFKWFIDNEQKINMCPENYQRCFVWEHEKQVELLRTIFDSKPGLLPEIHIRNYSNPISTIKRNGIIAEILDGQQRMTTMIRFLKNEIRTPKNLEFEQKDGLFVNISDKFVNELPKEAYDYYQSYTLQVAFYTDINDSEAADIFKNKLNSGKPLTKTEKRNAHNTEVARFIRNTARIGNGKNVRHDLFETTTGVKFPIAFKHFEETKFSYNAYAADELVAVICYMVLKGINSKCDDSELDRMYTNKDFLERFPHEKRVKNCLDVLKTIVTSSSGLTYKKLWNLSQLKHIMRIWMQLDIVEGYKLDNADKFVKSYIKTCDQLYKPSQYEKEQKKSYSYFKECITRQRTIEQNEYSVVTMIPEILACPSDWGLVIKNVAPREFPREMVLIKHLEQDGICPMCHELINIEDAQGGHIKAYVNGGETITDNLVVLHSRCNQKLGSKEFRKEDYVDC